MTCESVQIPGGGVAIVCGTSRKQRCNCGNRANLLCDWKVPARRSGTCDKPLCARCTHSPAPDKDLCPAHAAEWQARQAAPQLKVGDVVPMPSAPTLRPAFTGAGALSFRPSRSKKR